jgi:hypothetical protein
VDLVDGREREDPPAGAWRRYRVGEAFLDLESDDAAFLIGFDARYGEEAVAGGAGDGSPLVRCTLRSLDAAPVVVTSIDDPEALDPVDFIPSVFPERRFAEVPSPLRGWRTLGHPESPEPVLAARPPDVILDRRRPWQFLLSNCLVNRALWLQRDLLCFHAASVALDGAGVMLAGPKGSGKSTTSLTLASRGHDFLGDEVALVRAAPGELLPFRRTVSIRPGPCGRRLGERLGQRRYRRERFPDGATRIRARVGELFPEAGRRAAPLRAVFFLRRFAARPAVTPVGPGREHARWLAPLACTLTNVAAGRRMVQLARLLATVRCYVLDPGLPDETADLVERVVTRG